MPDLNIRPGTGLLAMPLVCIMLECAPSALIHLISPQGMAKGCLKWVFRLFFYFMHKLSTCYFPHRSKQQHGTGHCTGGPGPPDLSSHSHLPLPPLPQAPMWCREKPNLALLGRSAFPQVAAKFTLTGLEVQYHDLALSSHTRAACTLPIQAETGVERDTGMSP